MKCPQAKGVLLAALLGLCAGSGIAEDDAGGPPQRPCTEQDLAGTFVLMDFKETPEGAETSWHKQFPHHYIAFYPQHVYASLAINMPISSADHLKQYLTPRTKAASAKRYALKDGMLTLYTGRTVNYNYSCTANRVANGDYQKGDLILAGRAKDDTADVYNLYRRWY